MRLNNKKGLLPMIIVFQTLFIWIGVVCLWHLPARQNAKRQLRIEAEKLQADYAKEKEAKKSLTK